MIVKSVVLNEAMQEVFQNQLEIDALALTVAAETREEMARTKGADWTAGAIPFFGQELITGSRPTEWCMSCDSWEAGLPLS
ncbi:hypothetical protein [Duganella vulcania]|uniref:Uncharacterized protein n=1 Tax=Duganella vulcania TaxID=2692166 RepID=A0A845GTA7_9BURK|nr:hypothetical protein [Duganella vulcania]MYM96458.1 hypothetical protein [Duganella vulcania]